MDFLSRRIWQNKEIHDLFIQFRIYVQHHSYEDRLHWSGKTKKQPCHAHSVVAVLYVCDTRPKWFLSLLLQPTKCVYTENSYTL